MLNENRLRGHTIVCVNGEWLYKDTMTPTVGNERSCGHCGMENTNKGHDGCLGTVPEAMNACCGHGQIDEAYIQYFNGDIIRGDAALTEFEKISNNTI
jgi:hypothetical protein